MKRAKTYLVRAFAAAMVVALLMVNIQVDVEPPFTVNDIAITVNEAEAVIYKDMELADRICWTDGRRFLKCVHGGAVCDPSDQGSC